MKVEKPSLNRGGGLWHHLSPIYNAALSCLPRRFNSLTSKNDDCSQMAPCDCNDSDDSICLRFNCPDIFRLVFVSVLVRHVRKSLVMVWTLPAGDDVSSLSVLCVCLSSRHQRLRGLCCSCQQSAHLETRTTTSQTVRLSSFRVSFLFRADALRSVCVGSWLQVPAGRIRFQFFIFLL